MPETAADKLDNALDVDAQLAPIREGVQRIAKEVTDRQKTLDGKIDEQGKVIEAKLESLEGRFNKTAEDMISRMETIRKRSSILDRELGLVMSDDGLKDAVSKSFKERAGSFENISAAMPERSALRQPVVAMAVAEWFQRTTRVQLRKFQMTSQEDARQADKLYSLLQEKVLGSDWETITKAALAEGATDTGTAGAAVPTIVEADIVRQIKDAGKLFPRARQVQMNSHTHKMPSESGAVTVNWILEAGTLTAGDPTLASKTLTAIKLAGRSTMSIEVVEDANVGILNYLLEVFSEKMGGELDKQLVLGDGSSPLFTGIDNATGINVVASSATAAGRNLTWPLLVQTYVGGGEGVAMENGVWVVSPRGYSEIFGLSDSTGQPIVKFMDTQNAPYGTILGRPIILSARWGGSPSGVTATLDDSTNDNTRILYGVPSSLLFGMRTGLRWDVTDQVNWATYSMDARLIGRYAMVVGVPSNWSRLTKLNTPAF